jgi:KipI family sensor histidine kinase inhibitor
MPNTEPVHQFETHPKPIRPYGERAFLLENLNWSKRRRMVRAVEREPLPQFEEAVMGHDNLLLIFRHPVPEALVVRWLEQLAGQEADGHVQARTVEVPVRYDGIDLEAVARETGLGVRGVIDLHVRGEYWVRTMGFAPGFPYLDGLDPRLHLDRRASPRDRIEPGSVAIGGPHAGIYPVASPGGWHLLGRTELRLFRPERARGECGQPSGIFALAPGDRVRFIEV